MLGIDMIVVEFVALMVMLSVCSSYILNTIHMSRLGKMKLPGEEYSTFDRVCMWLDRKGWL